MEPEADDAAARFEVILRTFAGNPRITHGTGFGANAGLRVDGHIFAMLVRGQLVVKLPRVRVDQLADRAIGNRFEPGTGRVMKEWASISPDAGGDWGALVAEAYEFVGAAGTD